MATHLAPDAVAAALAPVTRNVARVIVGKDEAIELTLVAALVGGHILVEDVPGIGKTTLAKAFARSMGGTFSRIQCTPDLLPSDVTGVHILDQRQGTFVFQPGPVFANVVLVDELNRATPRTQAALLEAMEERQVTMEGTTRQLPAPFLVIATQNPIELEGTFPLPEAQLDRFLLRLQLGYPSASEEDELLSRFDGRNPLERLEPVVAPARLLEFQEAAQAVRVEPAVRAYLLSLVRATREHGAVRLGASPRASLALYHAAQALAALRGRTYVLPDDVKALATPVLGHRLILDSQARLRGRSELTVLDEVLAGTPVPVE
ncbi:MAG TPA: MoxR family ATPase [Chloroflexota bacterium]|nr:MoxR family ATPase [Chloroflexota bacterium]